MSTPRKLPWYQFSLRSVLLLTLVVAVLCSIGVSIHWALSAVIASIIVIGGVAGRVVAGTRLGFVQGAIFAAQFFLMTVLVCIVSQFPTAAFFWEASWGLSRLYVVLGIAVVIGGILGGLSVRPRSGRHG